MHTYTIHTTLSLIIISTRHLMLVRVYGHTVIVEVVSDDWFDAYWAGEQAGVRLITNPNNPHNPYKPNSSLHTHT